MNPAQNHAFVNMKGKLDADGTTVVGTYKMSWKKDLDADPFTLKGYLPIKKEFHSVSGIEEWKGIWL